MPAMSLLGPIQDGRFLNRSCTARFVIQVLRKWNQLKIYPVGIHVFAM